MIRYLKSAENKVRKKIVVLSAKETAHRRELGMNKGPYPFLVQCFQILRNLLRIQCGHLKKSDFYFIFLLCAEPTDNIVNWSLFELGMNDK